MHFLGDLRMRRPVANAVAFEDGEDVEFVDFSNAVLYISALQSIASVVVASLVTIASCALLPMTAVSSVRTVTLAAICGALVVKRPFSLGRVHGLLRVFRALQPCVDAVVPSWRRLVFNLSTLLMVVSGFLRARRPLASTDLPFLLTLLALFVAALLPPPAVIMSGPLCAIPTLQQAAERVVRAFIFALLYAIFVFAAAPPAQSSGEVFVCVARAFAATVWTLACNVYLLPLAFVQGGVVIYVRVFSKEYAIDGAPEPYSPVPQRDDDVEMGAAVAVMGVAADGARVAIPDMVSPATIATEPSDDAMIQPTFQSIGPRTLVDIGGTRASGLSQAQMAAVAARIE